MGEVSKLMSLLHMLRNWEKTYAQLKPKKNGAGNRIYKDDEVQLIFKLRIMTVKIIQAKGLSMF